MCDLVRKFEKEAEERGLQKGIEKGKEQGIEAVLDILSDEEISKRFKVDIKYVKEIREKQNNK